MDIQGRLQLIKATSWILFLQRNIFTAPPAVEEREVLWLKHSVRRVNQLERVWLRWCETGARGIKRLRASWWNGASFFSLNPSASKFNKPRRFFSQCHSSNCLSWQFFLLFYFQILSLQQPDVTLSFNGQKKIDSQNTNKYSQETKDLEITNTWANLTHTVCKLAKTMAHMHI